MDFALFMERYGYKLLFLAMFSAVAAVLLSPVIMAYEIFGKRGIAAGAVFTGIFLLGALMLITVPTFRMRRKLEKVDPKKVKPGLRGVGLKGRGF